MKLTAKTDLEAPIGFVYEALSDHQSWERDAAERGIRVERPADMPLSGPGAGWMLHLPYRGKLVKLYLRLVREKLHDHLLFEMQSNTVEGEVAMAVMALSPRRTRLHMTIEVTPRTLAARLLLNTLKLAKGRVQGRLDQRLGHMGTVIQSRYANGRR